MVNIQIKSTSVHLFIIQWSKWKKASVPIMGKIKFKFTSIYLLSVLTSFPFLTVSRWSNLARKSSTGWSSTSSRSSSTSLRTLNSEEDRGSSSIRSSIQNKWKCTPIQLPEVSTQNRTVHQRVCKSYIENISIESAKDQRSIFFFFFNCLTAKCFI